MAQYTKQQQLSVDELRLQISQRLSSNAAFSSKTYKDQPIIMTGTQLNSFVPNAIREARSIARHQHPGCCTVADVFYAQARLLAGYQDNFEFTGEFSHYYPTYEDMSNEQLRGYFAWRTQVRQGTIKKASLSFAYLYLYELIHLIGVSNALEGYKLMREFGQAYRRFDSHFGHYCDAWLNDFVIYYGLPTELLYNYAFATNDAAFAMLESWQQLSPQELFSALVQLSGYPIQESPFFIEHEQELTHLIVEVYRTVAEHHNAKLKNSLAFKLAGRMQTERIWPFQRAVFANPLKINEAEYKISQYDTIYCRHGAWFRTRYAALKAPLQWVTSLLETCESILRDAYAYPNMLGRPIKTKYIIKTAEGLAAAMVATARMRKQYEVHINFNNLDQIRKAADSTCEKLILEEPNQLGRNQQGQGSFVNFKQEEQFSQETNQWRQSSLVSFNQEEQNLGAKEPHKKSPLTSLEQSLLSCLLTGDSIHDFERKLSCIASVLIDSINEKLYDKFSDICIDTCSDTLQIIEDYAEELEALI